MNDPRLTKHWKVVEVMLNQASEFLHEPERFSIKEQELEYYADYINNSEFELAMDELAAIAKAFGCKSGFWRRLKKVADQMELYTKSAEYEKEFHLALKAKA